MTKGDSFSKLLLTAFILSLVFIFSSVIINAYPQKLVIGKDTVIGDIKFISNNTVLIKGNQVQLSQNDLVSLGGRDYIRITAKQVSLQGEIYNQGIRLLSPLLSQNMLFEQRIATFSSSKTAKIIIDSDQIQITPLSSDIINIKSKGENYNIELSNGISYINTASKTMLKLQKSKDNINVYVIGFINYQNIVVETK